MLASSENQLHIASFSHFRTHKEACVIDSQMLSDIKSIFVFYKIFLPGYLSMWFFITDYSVFSAIYCVICGWGVSALTKKSSHQIHTPF